MADTAGITLSLDDRGGAHSTGPSTEPQLVVALECSRPRAPSSRHSLAGVRLVNLGRTSKRCAERNSNTSEPSGDADQKLRIGVPDRWMSSSHARIEHSFGRWVLEDAGSKNGTLVNGAMTQRAVLADGDLIELGHTLFLFFDGVEVDKEDPRDVDLARISALPPGLCTLVPRLRRQFLKLEQIAASAISVLIHGETGTGKEVLARATHELSARDGDFMAVNCGAIPANLVESELFGYKKGAFSGAVEDRVGLIRSADKGTLFLDEIGDLPGASQAALLRVLQQREVVPVGGARPVPVDIRVIAATHRDLDAMVESGEFRRDLYARLAGYRINLPPLRDRIADLGYLVGVLLGTRIDKRHGEEHAGSAGAAEHAGFETEAARRLFTHPWPLNIRELEQCLNTATILAGDAPIDLEHLPDSVRTAPPARGDAEQRDGASKQVLNAEDRARRDALLKHLRESKGNISAVARAMGKDRKQIQRWLKRFSIDAAAFR